VISVVLYVIVVLIWGSTWLAVKYQIGPVSPEISIAYRMGSAALIIFLMGLIKRHSFRFAVREHVVMILQGASLFSLNFFFFYIAAESIITGLIAVICSTASAMTVILNCLFSRRLPPIQIAMGASLGILGVGLIFSGELFESQLYQATAHGFLYAVGGTFCFSMGTIIAAQKREPGRSSLAGTAWAMSYGTALLCFLAVLRGKAFNFDPSPSYVWSLAYLSVVGSVIAFIAYFSLLKRIRPEQAAYVTVLFPVVALTLSTFFEGYQWTAVTVLGVVITLLGNLLIAWRTS